MFPGIKSRPLSNPKFQIEAWFSVVSFLDGVCLKPRKPEI